MTRCENDLVTDPMGFPRDVCTKQARNKLILKRTSIEQHCECGHRHRHKFRLCDAHFNALKNEAEEKWGYGGAEDDHALSFSFIKHSL